LSATLKQIDPTKVELEIEIPPGDLEKAREAAFRELVRKAKVPGFRPGHVPRKIFEQQYGTEIIAERAMEELVPELYTKALREHEVDPVARPEMQLIPDDAGNPVRVVATVTVRPKIELGEYKGIELTAVTEKADDEDVERSMTALRRDAATLMPVDRPVQLGDVVTIDYEGRIGGEAFEGGKAEDESAEIREDRFIPGFAAGIVGMKAGETKEVTAHFPDEYGAAELAGKDATFTVTVHEVKEPELPALDDAFAARVSSHGTLLELKMDIRKRLDAMAVSRGRRAQTAQLVERLMERYDFPLPQILVDYEVESLLADSKNYIARLGREWSDYLATAGKTEEELRAQYLEEAQRRVKSTLLVEAIARAEGIEATTQDIEAEINALAEQYGQPRERILEMMRSNLDTLISGIVRTKTLDFLLDNAKIVEAPPEETKSEPEESSSS
jgi:trigger factor